MNYLVLRIAGSLDTEVNGILCFLQRKGGKKRDFWVRRSSVTWIYN